MKTLISYIVEGKQTYEFTVKLGYVDEVDINAVLDRVEQALEAYQVESISKPKSLPISPSRDFPSLGACQVFVFKAVLGYPATDAQIRELIVNRAFVSGNQVVVISAANPEEAARELADAAEGKEKEALLLTPELDDNSGQDLVGAAKIESFLKELETTEFEFAATEKHPKEKEIPVGDKSPVGSIQNDIPTVGGKK